MINVILFGAGKNGKAALKKFGKLTGFFCDNNMNKVGQYIDGIEVISFDEMIRLHNEKKYIIVITPVNSKSMEMQLKDAGLGVSDYIVLSQLSQYSDNVFEKADTYCTRPEIIDHNRMIDDLANDDSNKKLPLDVGDFISVVQKAMEYSVSKNLRLNKCGFNEESMYYGNAYSIMRYAGIESDQIRYFPTVCHYNIFMDCQNINEYRYRNAVIFQNDCFKRNENANVPYVPAFTVGAYINYAVPIYSDEKIKSLRDKYGPTLLASFPHSLENAKRNFDKKLLKRRLRCGCVRKPVKMFLADCDGTLTDGGMYYTAKGDIMKKFNTRDGVGFRMLKEKGIVTGIITGEMSEIVQKRGEKLGIDEVLVGVHDKLNAVKSLCLKYKIELSEVAYIGDDLNDMEVICSVGTSICTANAVMQIQKEAFYVTKAVGGSGAVREAAELVCQ